MMKKTHLIGGISIGTLAFKANQVLNVYDTDLAGIILVVPLITYVMGLVLGSLLPDIDTPNSFIGRRFKLVSIPINKTFGHRTITHSIWFATTLLLAVLIPSMAITDMFLKTLAISFALGLFIGDISHILLDSITKGGVPILYPISKQKISLTDMKTGGSGEQLVSVSLIIITIIAGFSIL